MIRDADRSREAILDAAERLFAERGPDGASLGEIAAEAGLSRGTPSYFFGSKDALYQAVLEHVFAARQAATLDALAPVAKWCDDGGDLETAFVNAVERYVRFIVERPSFAKLVLWEELAGAEKLRAATTGSDAMQRTFTQLREARQRSFHVGDLVLLFLALAYAPAAHPNSFMTTLGRDLTKSTTRRAHARLAARQLMAAVR